jgi:hypothetical protein
VKQREKVRQEKIKHLEERNRLREWEAGVNAERLGRKRKFYKEEMKQKLQ